MWKRFPSGGVHRAGTLQVADHKPDRLSRYRIGGERSLRPWRAGRSAPEAPRPAIHRVAETRLRACLAPIMRVDQAVARKPAQAFCCSARGPLTHFNLKNARKRRLHGHILCQPACTG